MPGFQIPYEVFSGVKALSDTTLFFLLSYLLGEKSRNSAGYSTPQEYLNVSFSTNACDKTPVKISPLHLFN